MTSEERSLSRCSENNIAIIIHIYIPILRVETELKT